MSWIFRHFYAGGLTEPMVMAGNSYCYNQEPNVIWNDLRKCVLFPRVIYALHKSQSGHTKAAKQRDAT